jgi:hypothetical protein
MGRLLAIMKSHGAEALHGPHVGDGKMHPTETDNLTLAAVAWFNMVAPQLNAEQSEVMRLCADAAGADLRVVMRFKEGTIALEGINEEAGKCVELFREDIEPLRVADHFGHHGEGGRH